MFAFLFGVKSISPSVVQQRTAELTVIDVNSVQSWQSAHVPGARQLDALTFTASDLPADKDSPLVFYCSNPLCRKAPNAARRAKQMGYTDVAVMSAGIKGWLEAGLPTASVAACFADDGRGLAVQACPQVSISAFNLGTGLMGAAQSACIRSPRPNAPQGQSPASSCR